jgi:hypothetical protein
MSDASPYFAVRNFTSDGTTWMPITAPMACNYWVVRGDVDLLICSDSSNAAATQDTVPAGVQEGVLEKQSPLSGTRYPASTTFAYVKAKSAPGNWRATFAV